MKPSLILAILMTALVAKAHEGAGEPTLGEHELKTLIYQSINVFILVAGLFYFIRKPVKDFFAQKRVGFLDVAKRAHEAQQKAAQERVEIEVRLSKLQNTQEESVSRARAEAAELKRQLILEAEALSQRMKLEAQATAKSEIERAKQALRLQMITGSLELAEKHLQEKLTQEDQSRFEKEFIANLQEVRP